MRGETGAANRAVLVLFGVAALFVLIPALFWWGTWFGNRLDDAELIEKLDDSGDPRALQHAVTEIAARLKEGRPGLDRWAAELVSVSRHGDAAVRVFAVHAMQNDASRGVFVERLREMVAEERADIVRRNAATSLAKSGDPAARPVLRAMLSAHQITAPEGGEVDSILGADQPVQEGDVVAVVVPPGGEPVEVRAPVPGTVSEARFERGAAAEAGAVLVVLAPHADHVWNATLALGIVGTAADLTLLRPLVDARSRYGEEIQRDAAWAIEQIERRSER